MTGFLELRSGRARKRGALDAEEGMWLLRAFRAATHVYFGYASFGEYIERLFGLNILRFEVGAETLAPFCEAIRELWKRSGHRLDDDAALLSMAREVLGGPGDAGRASYQVVVTQCEDCGRGFQHANGDLIELDAAILEMCHCDAQNVPVAHRHDADAPDGRIDADAQVGKAGEFAHARVGRGACVPPAGAELKRRRVTQGTPPAIRREVFSEGFRRRRLRDLEM